MAQRATSLGPNPPYLFFCFFVLFFGCLIQKNLVLPLEKGIFCLFSVFLFLSPLAFFGLPLFVFLFLCLSLFFFSFFLPSCLFFAVLWFLVYVSFFLFLSSLLFFRERNNIKIFNCKFFFLHQYFLFFWFPVFFLSSSFFLSLLVPDFKVYFLFNIKVFGFKTDNLKTYIFGQKGGCNKTVFYQPVLCKMWKVIVYFWPFFGQFLGDVQKTL